MNITLGDVETTALIPLSIKANETKRPSARIKDNKAVAIISALGIDTAPYDKFMSHEGVIARTIMLDKMVKDFISKNPEGVIVNLGAGFDNRLERVDNGKIFWFDLDLADSIATRKKAFEESERNKMLCASVLEDTWCAEVKAEVSKRNASVLFIAEGLFMYLSMEDIKKILSILKNNFEHAVLFAEQNNPMMVKHQKYHDTVRNTNAVFRSGTKSAQEIADLVDGVKLVEEHSFNEEMKKYSIRAKIFALLLPSMNDRWAIFEW